MNPPIDPWPFDQPRNCATFTVRQVMEKTEPILAIYHDLHDHDWQFIGSTGANMEDAMLVSLEEVVKLDLSTLNVADLLPGWHAVRSSPKHPWFRRETPVSDEESLLES